MNGFLEVGSRMSQFKVAVVVGTRPELIRLSRVLAALDKYFSLCIIHTGQNHDYELNQVFFDDLCIRKPDYFLNCAEDSKGPADTIGRIISKVDAVFADVQPEALLVLGDTNSCLSVIPAKRRKIPIFHMEAGNRCFDQRVPEETNRKIVDHVADINLTYSDIAREYLLREGISPDRIIKTGSPMFEVLNYYRAQINNSDIINSLNLTEKKYFVVSIHREENIEIECNFKRVIQIINYIADKYMMPVIFSAHPRTRNKISREGVKLHNQITLLKPLGFFDYIKLQQHSNAVLSDSGTITEESSILNFPALNIREAHERPEGMEEASVMMTGLAPERVLQSLTVLQQQSRGGQRMLEQVGDYSMPNVSEKVVRIILSYTDYINRVVWKKSLS